jgi:hypothetical protein
VQGNRTVGIAKNPRRLPRSLQRCLVSPPRHHGHDAVKALQAMIDGEAKALLCLGGNFAVAMPDHERVSGDARAGSQRARRDQTEPLASAGGERDVHSAVSGPHRAGYAETGRQSITVEDSMSMVHASSGKLKPASPLLRSEPAIVAGMAMATLANTKVDWLSLVAITTVSAI